MLDDNAESSEEQGQEHPHPSEEEPPPQKKRKLGEILQQDSTEDPLEWWKANAASCPALSRLSTTYLCIMRLAQHLSASSAQLEMW